MQSNVWLRSRAYDLFFLHAGLWTMLIVIPLAGNDVLKPFHFTLGVLFWIGHRLATAYLAFCQQAYQELLVEQRTRFVTVPLVFTVVVFVMLLIPESILPIPLLYRVLPLAVLDFAWEFYHFTMQHYGVVSVYRIRAQQDPGAVQEKRLEKIFCMTVFGGGIPAAVVYHSLVTLSANNADFIIPGWAIQTFRFLAIAFALGFTARMVIKELSIANTSMPKIMYMIAVGVPVSLALILDSMAPALLVLAIQHWLVAVGISAHMASGTGPVRKAPNAWYRFWGFVNRTPFRVLVVMCIFSAVLAPVMEFSDVERRLAVKTWRGMFSPTMTERSYVYWGEMYLDWFSGLGEHTVLMFFVAAGFSFGFVHYLMDRAIFRFSNAATRRSSLPLLLGRG